MSWEKVPKKSHGAFALKSAAIYQSKRFTNLAPGLFDTLEFDYGHSAHLNPKLYNFPWKEFNHKRQSLGAETVKALRALQLAKRGSSSSKGHEIVQASPHKAKAP